MAKISIPVPGWLFTAGTLLRDDRRGPDKNKPALLHEFALTIAIITFVVLCLLSFAIWFIGAIGCVLISDVGQFEVPLLFSPAEYGAGLFTILVVCSVALIFRKACKKITFSVK